jgi:hypothetical protein
MSEWAQSADKQPGSSWTPSSPFLSSFLLSLSILYLALIPPAIPHFEYHHTFEAFASILTN